MSSQLPLTAAPRAFKKSVSLTGACSLLSLMALLFCSTAVLGQDLVPPVSVPPLVAGKATGPAPLFSDYVAPVTTTPNAGTRAVNGSAAAWAQQGPIFSIAASGYGIPALAPNPADPQVGSVNRLAANGTTILAAASNGGIWRTTNTGTLWTASTETFPLSISAVAFDFTSPAIAVAGFGRTSSLSKLGSSTLMGILRSSDNGATWTAPAGAASLPQLTVSSVQSNSANGTILVAFKNTIFSNDGGLWRSTDNGATFTNISATAPLTTGSYTDLASDPANAGTYYVAHRGSGQGAGQNAGVFRSTDYGATWTDITGGMPAVGTTSDYIRIAVGPTAVVFVGVVNSSQLAAVYRAVDGRTGAPPTWVVQGTSLPGTTEMGTFYGIHPGSQGSSQFGLVADPNDNTVVYVAGDRTPANNENGQAGIQFPNSIGSNTYSGSVFRFKAGVWQTITNGTPALVAAGAGTASNSAPHADNRDIIFEGTTGNLLDACDGGVYRRNLPQLATGDWTSASGNMAISEFHSAAYDGNYNIAIGGAQDNGVAEQATTGASSWTSVDGGDGGNVAVDDSVAGTSIRYSCSQNWGGFHRRTVTGGVVTDDTRLGLMLNGARVKAGVQFYGPYAINAITPTRMVFGTNNVLESADRGDTLADVSGDTGNEIVGLVYGGKSGGVDNPELLYAGSGAALRLRATAGGPLNVLTTYTGGTVRSIAVDPADWKTALVGDANNKVWLTTDAGASAFVDVTGNLPLTNLRSVSFLPAAGNVRVLLAGGQGGVYAAGNGEFNVWTQVGSNLPAQIYAYDLSYNARANVLCIGTLGRGAYTIPAASTIFSGAVLTFTSIAPNTGQMAGGNTITINGTGFTGTPVVTFGAALATGVANVTATSFTCVAPAGAVAGSVDVSVAQGGQTLKLVNAYSYVVVPAVAGGISPNEGVVTGGTTCVITGSNFTVGATVSFGTLPATGVVVNAGNRITCVSPAGTGAGPVTVTVTEQGVKSAGAAFTYLAFAPAPPTITSIIPTSGPAAGGTSITVTGTGFNLTPNTMSLTFNGVVVTAPNITVVSATSMTLSTPPGNGSLNVSVIASDAGTASAPFTGFAYTGTNAPVATVAATVSQAFGPPGLEDGVGMITISLPAALAVGKSATIGFSISGSAEAGTDYETIGASSVTINGPSQMAIVQVRALARTTLEGPKTVTLTLNEGAGYLVGTPVSATVTILDLNEPNISQVTPSTGSTAGGDKVLISGSNFAQGMTVQFNGVPATNVVVENEALITAKTPPGAAGTVDVTLNANGFIATLTQGFTYVAPPTLSAVAPLMGTTAGGTAVTLTGANYAAGATVSFNGVAATSVVVLNATTITCVTPANAAGVVPVAITVNGVTQTFASQYTYITPPSILSLAPASGLPVGGTAVTITGNNFVAGATVTFGGKSATKIVVVNANSMTCVTPAGTGLVDVVVTVSGVTGTLVKGFTYVIPVPLVTTLIPNSGTSAGGTSVTISGGNFGAGSTVTFGGAAAGSIVIVNAGTITCTSPAGSGVVDVVVTFSGVSGTLAKGFTYVIPNPVVTGITPNIGVPAGGTSITIKGANFGADATVLIGGNAAVNVLFVDAATITCNTPPGTGTVDVSVVTSGLTGTFSNGFTYFDTNATGTNTLVVGQISGKFGQKPSSDILKIQGKLPLPSNTPFPVASVTVTIGAFSQVYALNGRGVSPDKNNNFKLSFVEINGYTAFTLSLKKQDLSKLKTLGFGTTDANVSMPIAITVNGATYRFPKLVGYFAKSGSYFAK